MLTRDARRADAISAAATTFRPVFLVAIMTIISAGSVAAALNVVTAQLAH